MGWVSTKALLWLASHKESLTEAAKFGRVPQMICPILTPVLVNVALFGKRVLANLSRDEIILG